MEKKTLEFEYLKFLLCGDDQNHFNLSAAVGPNGGFPKDAQVLIPRTCGC